MSFLSKLLLRSFATATALGLLLPAATAAVPATSSPAAAPVTATSTATVQAAAPLPVRAVAIPTAWTQRGFSGALQAVVADPGSPLDGALEVAEAQRAALGYRWQALAAGKGLKGGKAVEASAGETGTTHALREGLRAPARPGIWTLQLADASASAARVGSRRSGSALQLITPVRHDGKSAHLNGYHVGRYPAATSAEAARLGARYAPPERFIEVTPANQDTYVSRHFQLRHFLTKDQQDLWPKYLVLDLALVDKLELLIQELQTQGFARRGLHVMSGFRTPQYNAPGVGKGGRATFSRHTYGDAADVWVDDDGDGRMDDLNRDGRVDIQDAEVLAAAVDRVEARVPQLVGGYGVYKANRVHGPFVHVDVRGTPARWTNR